MSRSVPWGRALVAAILAAILHASAVEAQCEPGWNAQPRPVQVGEWLLLVRVPKTASKTTSQLLVLHAASLRNVPVSACWTPATNFRTAMLPTTGDVVKKCADPKECDTLLSLRFSPASLRFGGHDTSCPEPFDFYRALKPRVDKMFFVGSDFNRGDDALKSLATPCLLATNHHLTLPDILQGTMRVPRNTIGPSDLSDRRRLIVLIREPTSRTVSEFKHANSAATLQKGKALWDYHFNPCLSQSYYKNDSSIEERMKCFVLAKEHAIGVENRQTKMISGMTVAPHLEEKASKERVLWEATALKVAKEVVDHADLVILSERMPESIAVLFHRFRWLPSLGVVQETLKGMASATPRTIHTLTWSELVAVGNAVNNHITVQGAEDGVRIDLSPSLSFELARRNQLDSALYEYANKTLDATIEAIRRMRGG